MIGHKSQHSYFDKLEQILKVAMTSNVCWLETLWPVPGSRSEETMAGKRGQVMTQTLFVAHPLFRLTTLTKSLKQARKSHTFPVTLINCLNLHEHVDESFHPRCVIYVTLCKLVEVPNGDEDKVI